MLAESIGLVVANEPSVMGEEKTRVTILMKDGSSREVAGSKESVAEEILSSAMEIFSLTGK